MSDIDVGILTIREDEFRAVLGVFPNGKDLRRLRRHYNIRTAEAGPAQTYRVAILRQLEQGNGEAQEAARDMIEELKPRLLIVVGIAGGLPHDDFTLGDVIVSTRINDYNVEACKEGEAPSYNLSGGPIAIEIAAGIANLPAMDAELGDWFGDLPARPLVDLESAEIFGPDEWAAEVRGKLAHHFGGGRSRPPLATAGTLASSDRLIKDPQVLFPWIQTARHIVAVEMESAGVYRAARDRSPMLAIRGISDIVGLKREDGWTKYACASAAAFVRAYLRTTPIPPASPPRSSATTLSGTEPSTLRTDESAQPAPERPPAEDDGDSGSRARDVDRSMRELASGAPPNWATEAARLAAKLLSSGSADDRTLMVVRGWAMGWGWHFSKPASFAEVFEAMPDNGRAEFLLVLLRMRAPQVFFHRGRTFDAALELRDRFWAKLSPDERAEVHLAIARRLWAEQDQSGARSHMSNASASASSAAVKEQVHLQLREWAFAAVSASEVRAGVDSEVVDASTLALQHCRRGADALLLGEIDVARTHYDKALACAKTGDERSVALRGKRLTLDPMKEYEEDERVRQQLLAIPPAERPLESQVESLRRGAGAHALRGESQSASDDLVRFLAQARELGFPHSSRVNYTGPLEQGARDLTRILLLEADLADVRRGFEILLQYGLAREVEKWADVDLIQRTLAAPDALAWLRNAVANRSRDLLPRSELARRALAAHMLHVLSDDAIVDTLTSVRERVLQSTEQNPMLVDEWMGVVSSSPCLHEPARRLAAEIECDILSDEGRSPLLRGRLPQAFWEYWATFNGPPESLRKRISTALIDSLSVASVNRDTHRERDSLVRIADLAETGTISGDARACLVAEIQKQGSGRNADPHIALFRIVAVLALESGHAEALLDTIIGLFPEVRRSTDAAAWCWAAGTIAETVKHAPRELIEVAQTHADDVLAQRDDHPRLLSPARAARLLRTLADVAPPSDALSIITKLNDLGAAEMSCIGLLGGLKDHTVIADATCASIRDALLDYGNAKRRATGLFAVIDWMEYGGTIPSELRYELRQLVHADDSGVRTAAFQGFRDLLRLASTDDERAWLAVQSSAAARTDKHWLVRANAGHTYVELSENAPALIRDHRGVLDALRNDESALSRRIAELGEFKLAKRA